MSQPEWIYQRRQGFWELVSEEGESIGAVYPVLNAKGSLRARIYRDLADCVQTLEFPNVQKAMDFVRENP